MGAGGERERLASDWLSSCVTLQVILTKLVSSKNKTQHLTSWDFCEGVNDLMYVKPLTIPSGIVRYIINIWEFALFIYIY